MCDLNKLINSCNCKLINYFIKHEHNNLILEMDFLKFFLLGYNSDNLNKMPHSVIYGTDFLCFSNFEKKKNGIQNFHEII